MPTAKKLPSGSWRCQVYSHTDENGKKIKKSFTCKDPSLKGKRICEAEATAWAKEKESQQKAICLMTFKEGAEEYIKLRSQVRSPRTIDGYERYIGYPCLSPIINKKINHITQSDVQKIINDYAKDHSPKTCQNIHGFISTVLKTYRPDFHLNTALPQKKEEKMFVPDDDVISALLDRVVGTNLEIPVLLAAFGPMRRGEISALTSDDILGDVVYVNKNMVKKITNGKKEWVLKSAKSYAGTRYIVFPDFVMEKLRCKEGRICDLLPDSITTAFTKLRNELGFTECTFHDLRHYSASIQHALGIPDIYIQERGGWGDNKTLRKIYTHVLSNKKNEFSDRANDYFAKLGSHESSHELKKVP